MKRRLFNRLAVLLWAWCIFNLLWSLTGSWIFTIERMYTPFRGFDKGSLDSQWEADRFIANCGGDLILNWPLFPEQTGYVFDGMSLFAEWSPHRTGWHPSRAFWDKNYWADWIGASNGLSWHGLLIVRNPQLYYRNYRGIAVPWWMPNRSSTVFVRTCEDAGKCACPAAMTSAPRLTAARNAGPQLRSRAKV